jgi:branched-chain amino acid transport system permease protein
VSPPWAVALLQGLASGVLYGSLLGVVAVGLTLIWGVMKVVNLAHGHLVVLAAMLSAFFYTLFGSSKANPLLDIVYMAALGAVVGAAFYYASLHKIIGNADTITLKLEMSTLMSTFGIGLIIYGLHYTVHAFYPSYSVEPAIGWTLGKPPYIKLGPIILQKANILVGILGLIISILAYLFLTKTMTGLWVRAVAQDSRALALAGVNPVRTKLIATIVSVVIAMSSGALWLAYQKSASPLTESLVAPLSFVIVVLGGLGNVIGTYLSGLLLGIVYMTILSLTQQQALALSVVFAIFLIALIFRPEGLFTR